MPAVVIRPTLDHRDFYSVAVYAMNVDGSSSSLSSSSSSSSSEYLTKLASQAPESLHGHIAALQKYSDRKLWHQLTNTLQDILRQPESAPFQIDLYQNFVSKYAKRLDQLWLVEIAVAVAQQYEGAQTRQPYYNSMLLTSVPYRR